MSTPHLHVIALGGTIASVPADSGGGVVPSVGAEEIAAAAHLDDLPASTTAHLRDDGEDPAAPPLRITFEQLAQVGSGSITLSHLGAVVRAARRAAAAGAHGIVLTQGTDTLEDSAFVLALLNDSGIPIAVTGAMRNPSLPGADGGANVRAAALTALSPQVRELAAQRRLASVLVFADELHDPLYAVKAHTTSVAAFASGPGMGPLGWVSEDRVLLPHVPLASREVPGWKVPEAAAALGFARIALVEAGLGDDLALLEALPGAGYSGCVLSGVGGGHVSVEAVERAGALAAEMPVVLASRTGAGAVLERTYGYPGAELDLIARGLVPAGVLDARKARLALVLAHRFETAFPAWLQ
ncbi:asparaginase domain-containing protein [Brevibacterium album]|uniref:asparaginase domain-containing protein n=1 Tax=Brevibacterium album TaxID=417948 RepID=UPI00040CEE80|nr:asparaginase domain-containing protein [Brevibacterium album]